MTPQQTFAIATAPRRDSRHWRNGVVTWAEILGWLESPASVKECGNYLLGTLAENTTVVHDRDKPDVTCTNTHRRKDFVRTRSWLSLDLDSPEPDCIERAEMLLSCAFIWHTTFKSTPSEPRYRLLIPLSRELALDEYVAAARAVMALLGVDQFDPGSSEPERYMFKPSASKPEWFASGVEDGDPMDADTLLSDFEEDLSTKPIPKPHRNKRNPFELDGVIGAFNRAYEDLELLVAAYELPYTQVGDDRWQLVGARSVAGMGPVADTDGLFYSHHVSDPAYGKTCSAFDLARLHLFGELDEGEKPQTPINRLPSHKAMLELASGDHRVTAELVGEMESLFDDLSVNDAPAPEAADPDVTSAGTGPDWRLKLKLTSRTGEFMDVIGNWDLVRANDAAFATLRFNELTLSVEVNADLPWRKLHEGGPLFSGTDRSALCHYLERVYKIRPARSFIDELVDTWAQRSRVNPLRDYLSSLEWDGTSRVETCLPGVRPTMYTRLVARKTMVAAVARVFEPGIKWDHTTVFQGPEGLGKTLWTDKMSLGYSAALGRIGDKDTLLTMQRSWIMIADEGNSLRKADSDTRKEFLTRTEDTFRMPYDRDTLVHKRHCVIWATTNDETFLRREEGNRRFLIVECTKRVDFDALTPAYIDQVWAEAVHLYRAGELLFLSTDESALAAVERERYIEEDALAGVIQSYLDTLVPTEWDEMSPEQRRLWVRDSADGMVPVGTERIDRTCSTQLWVEALGRRMGDHRRVDLLEITNALKRLPGWTPLPSRERLPGYGPQTVYVRSDEPTAEDLL